MSKPDSVYHNIISAKQLQEIIKTNAQTVISHPDLAADVGAIIVRGCPGVGKSSIVKAVAKEMNIGFVDVRLAQMDRCDLLGIPTVQNGTTVWNVPSNWPQDQDSAGILFFDEITSAPAECQVAAYSLILDRAIPNTNYKLPPKWIIVAAGNKTTDRAVVKTMSSALANRFVHYELDANADEWVEYAISKGLNPSVTGFIQYRPALLFTMDNQNLECGWPTPRSWEKVSVLVNMFSNNEDICRKAVYGAVGPGAGTEFFTFHKLQKKFESVEKWLTDANPEINIPDKADEKFAVVSAISYHLWKAKSPADHQLRLLNFFKILEKLSSDFAYLLVHLASLGNNEISKLQAIGMLMQCPSYQAFMLKHKEAFSKKYSLN